MDYERNTIKPMLMKLYQNHQHLSKGVDENTLSSNALNYTRAWFI